MRFLLAFQQDPDPFQIISNFLESPILRISGQLVLLLFIVLWVSLVYWTYADASRRGAISVLWGFIAFIFPYVGTLVYLIVRPPEYLQESRASSRTLSFCAPTAATWSRETT